VNHRVANQGDGANGFSARCPARGVQRDISIFMVRDDPPQFDDFVMVSMGQAVRKVSAEDARHSWDLYDQILADLG